LRWFDENDFEFINSVPKLKAFAGFSKDEEIFKKNPYGNSIDHLIGQLKFLLSGGGEGGLYIMIGKRKS